MQLARVISFGPFRFAQVVAATGAHIKTILVVYFSSCTLATILNHRERIVPT
jgi:hypothetical protein